MYTDKCHDQVVGAVRQLHTKHPGVGRERWMGRWPAPSSLCDSAHDKVTNTIGWHRWTWDSCIPALFPSFFWFWDFHFEGENSDRREESGHMGTVRIQSWKCPSKPLRRSEGHILVYFFCL